MRNIKIFLVIFLCFGWCSAENLLPSYIKPCIKSDPQIHKCVQENIKILRPKLKVGIPALFIPPLDPLVLPPTPINEGDQVTVTFTDIEIYNADEFYLDEFAMDFVQNRVNLSIRFPYLRIKSKYNIRGRFLLVDHNETGPADGNYTNFRVNLTLRGTPFTVNQKSYIKWKNETISIEIGDSQLELEGLFGNHTEISEKTNKLINENFNLIIADLKPVLQDVVSNFVSGIVNNLFASYTLTDLFKQ
ncbi:unnamed protein product [Ceutorhynchus assimilis]|uniref:Takeout n=1 Tax=Ceutorhynchus assimilis TaxID=467358 RepID=A0A9P0DIP0_9CUCU|nr:unnamed protein product [Ceutorhynchus assimilis]